MSTTVERARKHRAKLRKGGLRPIQLWILDSRAPGFAAECQRQLARLRDDPHEQAIMAELADLAGAVDDWKP